MTLTFRQRKRRILILERLGFLPIDFWHHRFEVQEFALTDVTFAMASYDIDSIMAEHGLSRDEAGEVLRVLKSGTTTPAVDTLYLFSV
jgi:hypothetical protein